MSSSYKNIAIAGAAGLVGDVVFRKLVEAPNLKVRVLRNKGSKSTYPSGTDVVDVDYSSVKAVTAALAGQDVLVSTVGAGGIPGQYLLIDAAIAAGVKRFLPSDFGANMDNPNVGKLILFGEKVKVHQYLVEKSKTTDITYTNVYTGSFMDWGFENNMTLNLLTNKPEIINGGDIPFSASMLSTTGDAVVAVLAHPDETKNRSLCIADYVTTQNELLARAKQIAPEKNWEPVHAKLDDLEAIANDRLSKGIFDIDTFRPYIFRAVFDPTYGGKFDEVDNELIGLKEKTEEDLIESMKRLLK
ncbi:Fc.00g080200.m01.CDS01 [Cosmosporella sp. VM-42]